MDGTCPSPPPASTVQGRPDVLYLYAARAARGFGDGFAAIILPAYLLEIGFDPFQIGLVATAALLGSAATTMAVGFLAPRYHLRTLLLACAALMVLTGVAIQPSPSRLHRHRCLHRHDESGPRHRRARPARTSCDRTARVGRGADADFRAL